MGNIKGDIPEGMYCYTFTGEVSETWNDEIKSMVTLYKTKTCPFYKDADGLFGECIKLKCEVMDQIKECGENMGY